MIEGFAVRTLQSASSQNERGKRTWEWRQSDGKQITVYRRRKREKFAQHFHKGTDPSKSPERFLLLEGNVSVTFHYLTGQFETITLDAAQGPVELLIMPWVLHEFYAHTDCCFIEYRLDWFEPTNQDTFGAEEFRREEK